MDETVQTQLSAIEVNNHHQAWEIVAGQLRLEMPRSMFETYIQPLQPLGYAEGVFRLGAYNAYIREWAESRLKSLITRQLEGLFNQQVTLRIQLMDDGKDSQPALIRVVEPPEEETAEAPSPLAAGKASPRKLALQRAYGSKRAAVIQPERSLMITQYFFSNWLPLIGHSAFAVILAARSMCYWNPLNGELRNEIETDMAEIAGRAAVSVRTVKTVLNDELVRKHFLRYKTRRIMTPNGVRTAGILLFVRMDDPLTPEDQGRFNLEEEPYWYSPDFGEENIDPDE